MWIDVKDFENVDLPFLPFWWITGMITGKGDRRILHANLCLLKLDWDKVE